MPGWMQSFRCCHPPRPRSARRSCGACEPAHSVPLRRSKKLLPMPQSRRKSRAWQLAFALDLAAVAVDSGRSRVEAVREHQSRRTRGPPSPTHTPTHKRAACTHALPSARTSKLSMSDANLRRSKRVPVRSSEKASRAVAIAFLLFKQLVGHKKSPLCAARDPVVTECSRQRRTCPRNGRACRRCCIRPNRRRHGFCC